MPVTLPVTLPRLQPARRPARRAVATLAATTVVAAGLTGVAATVPAAAAEPPAPTTTAAEQLVAKPLRARYKKPRLTKVQRALRIARAQAGDPYRYGAAGPNAFDCSGLVYFATHRAGFRGVPRSSGAQSGFMRRIAKSNIRKGDFVFFTGGGGVYHVGIYVGRNRILHSPYSGTRVRVERIWTGSWFAGTLRGR